MRGGDGGEKEGRGERRELYTSRRWEGRREDGRREKSFMKGGGGGQKEGRGKGRLVLKGEERVRGGV